MATDATGTPTSNGIPTFQTNVDAPSGRGFNAAMSVIDTLMTTALKTVFKKSGVTIGTRHGLNFIQNGIGTTVTVADNAGSDQVDVTLANYNRAYVNSTGPSSGVVNSTTNTSIITLSGPSALDIGGTYPGAIRYVAGGWLQNNTGSTQNITAQLVMNGAAIAAGPPMTFTIPTAAGIRPWRFEMDVQFGGVAVLTGAGPTQFASGRFSVGTAWNPGDGNWNTTDLLSSTFDLAPNVFPDGTTGTFDLTLKFQLGAASANLSLGAYGGMATVTKGS